MYLLMTSAQEKIERKMLELKYKRVEIQEEKEEKFEQLKKNAVNPPLNLFN